MSEAELFGRGFAPVILVGPALRHVWALLYGNSQETRVLNALLVNKSLTLSSMARECGASERSVRRGSLGFGGDRTGWLRGILERYVAASVVTERREGNRIIYKLNEASPAVVLLRELRIVPENRPPQQGPGPFGARAAR